MRMHTPRVTAHTPLGGAVEGPGRTRRIRRRAVVRSLRRSLEILAARAEAGYPCRDYQMIAEVSNGGAAYQGFKQRWDRQLRVAGGKLGLSTSAWPGTLPAASLAAVIVPLCRAGGRYRLGLEPMWAVKHSPSPDLDLWIGAQVDAWIKWIFTALSTRTGRLGQPIIAHRVGGSRQAARCSLLSLPIDWPVRADKVAALDVNRSLTR